MKKNLQILTVVLLVVIVVGLANLDTVLANLMQTAPQNDLSAVGPLKLNPVPPLAEITETGVYNVEGICNFEITFEPDSAARAVVQGDVDPDFSSHLPFGYLGDLYLPGCHVLHYDNDNNLVREISSEDGTARVCFAERPDVTLTVFYYFEEPFTSSQIWIELPTTHEEDFACAPALYSGEYAPGTKVDTDPPESDLASGQKPKDDGGTIVVPPSRTLISRSGTYNVGGICSLIVLYREPGQTNDLHVADAWRYNHDPIDAYDYERHDVFPDPEAFLFQPGCHVLHYQDGEITHWDKNETLGDWKICFAAQPGYEMTIYNYLGDMKIQEASWLPLETTVEDGEACAPAFYTGVYVPTGKKIVP